MTTPSFAGQLEQALDKSHEPIEGALLTYAFDPVVADLVTARCEFMSAAPTRLRDTADYGHVQLAEKWLPRNVAVDFLKALTEGKAIFDEKTIADTYPFSGVLVQRKAESSRSITGWSEWLFELRRSGGPRIFAFLHEPLVRTGLRPYNSGAQAVAEQIWNVEGPWHGGLPPHLGEILAAAPDTRARIRSVEWLPGYRRSSATFA